jgi:hypothetical protein
MSRETTGVVNSGRAWLASSPPTLKHERAAPRMAGLVVIMIRRKRVMAAWKMASQQDGLPAVEARLALGPEREVDPQDDVLLHDPDQEDHTDQGDDDRQPVGEALQEDGKHVVDRHDRRLPQRLAAERLRADERRAGTSAAPRALEVCSSWNQDL